MLNNVRITQWNVLCVPVLIFLMVSNETKRSPPKHRAWPASLQVSQVQVVQVPETPVPNVKRPRKAWISLSVCFSGNTKHFGKDNFDYLLATRLSTDLWRKVANLSSVVQVVYDPQNYEADQLDTYLGRLRKSGCLAKAVPNQGPLECSLKAQLQRMFVVNIDEIEAHDLVVTSDVDTYPMESFILDELKMDYAVWLFQYEETKIKGQTLNMNFIAMTKHLWQELMPKSTPEEVVELYNSSILAKETTTWGYDQLIASKIILQSGLCFLDPKNPLWQLVLLDPPKYEADDSQICFRGDRWWDCNKARTTIPTGCLRWHFHPEEKPSALVRKYKDILRKFRTLSTRPSWH